MCGSATIEWLILVSGVCSSGDIGPECIVVGILCVLDGGFF